MDITVDLTEIDKKDKKHFCMVLAASILDLDKDYMAVGGLTAVGHGIFSVKEVMVYGKALHYKKTRKNLKIIRL